MCISVPVLIYNCNFRIIISSGKFMYRALASSVLNGGTPCLCNPHIGIAVDNLGPEKGVGLSILHEPPDHKPNQTERIRTTKPQKGAGMPNRYITHIYSGERDKCSALVTRNNKIRLLEQ